MLISDFLQYVLPDVVGCPRITATKAVIAAAKEFLTYSGAWNEIQDPVTLIANISEYDLEDPTDGRCIDIRNVYAPFACGGKLRGVTIEQLNALLPTWESAQANLPNLYTRAFDFASIRVYPQPTDPNGASIQLHATYTLKDTSTTIPDVIVQRYQEEIASGAKARLMAMSKVQWADKDLAKSHKDAFDGGKLAARITTLHGNTSGSIFVTPRRFGA